MKIFWGFIILIFSCHSVIGQADDEVSKRRFFVGGSGSYSTSTNDQSPNLLGTVIILNSVGTESNISSLSLRPRIGYMLTDHIAAGLIADYRYTSIRTESIQDIGIFGPLGVSLNDRKERTIGAGVFLRYIINPQNRFQVNIEPALSYFKNNIDFSGRLDDTLTVGDGNTKSLFANVSLGLTYNISERFRLISRVGGFTYEKGQYRSTMTVTLTDQDFIIGAPILGTKTFESEDFSSFTTNFNLSNIFFGVEFLF